MKQEEFKKFMHTGNTSLYVAAGVAVAAGVLAYLVRESGSPWLVLVIGAVVCAFLIWSWFDMCRDYDKFIATHTEQGDLDQIIEDFSQAESWFDGAFRTGERVLYRSGPELLEYRNILNFYEYVHSTNGAEDRRALYAVLLGGEKSHMCALKTRGRSNDELARFFSYMQQKNPDITFGYEEAKKAMRG